MSETVNNLLQSAIEGDREALAALLERHGPSLRDKLTQSFPQRWRSVLSEDDVLQQTYVDAVRDIHRFVRPDEASFAFWLESLARRNLLDAIRMLETVKRGGTRRRVRAATNGDSMSFLDTLGASMTTPSRGAARLEAEGVLQRAIECLPEDYRQVVRLYDIQGLAVEEVARVLHRSCGAVYMLRARAHRVLCEAMGSATEFLSSSA